MRLEDGDCQSWKITSGRPVVRVLCSRFCKNELLRQYYELHDSLKSVRESTPVKTLTKTFCRCKIYHGITTDMTVCNCTCDKRTESASEANIQTDTAHRNENYGEQYVPEDNLPNIYYLLWEDILQFPCSKVINCTPTTTSDLQQFLCRKIEVNSLSIQSNNLNECYKLSDEE